MRGCYRLHRGVEGAVEGQDDEDENEEEASPEEEDEESSMSGDDEGETAPPLTGKIMKRRKGKEVLKSKEGKKTIMQITPSKQRKKRAKTPSPVEYEDKEGEFFDLSNVSSSDSELSETRPSAPKHLGRATKPTSPRLQGPLPRTRSASRRRTPPHEIDFFDLKGDSGLEDALSILPISSPGPSDPEAGVSQAKQPSPKTGRGRPKRVYIEISD